MWCVRDLHIGIKLSNSFSIQGVFLLVFYLFTTSID
jgi:hypothetical protein